MARLILLTDFSEEYARLLLRGIVSYSKEHTAWVLCKMPLSYRDMHGIEGVVEWALKWGADAIIGQFYPEDNVGLFAENGIIAIAQDFKTRFDRIPNITGNHTAAGRMGARYFIEKGFKNFAFYGFEGIVWSKERAEGFRGELINNGLSDSYHEYRNEDFKEIWYYESDRLVSWLRALPKPVAMMACDDNQAQHIVEIGRSYGFKIPEEIALLGVDNDETVCETSYPAISSINQAVEKGGYEVAAMIDSMISNREFRGHNIQVLPTHITTRQSTDVYASNDRYVSEILRHIHDNINTKLNVGELSKLVPLSRRLLESKFKQITGMPIYQYIFNLRISKFAERLLDSDAPVIEIAVDMGFSDYKNISRQFRNIKGCTPTEWRIRNKT